MNKIQIKIWYEPMFNVLDLVLASFTKKLLFSSLWGKHGRNCQPSLYKMWNIVPNSHVSFTNWERSDVKLGFIASLSQVQDLLVIWLQHSNCSSEVPLFQSVPLLPQHPGLVAHPLYLRTLEIDWNYHKGQFTNTLIASPTLHQCKSGY